MSRIRANQITNENANGAPDFPHGLTYTGIITTTTIPNPVPNLTVNGNLGLSGTLTSEDVTNEDSIGIVTARTGVKIGPTTGVGATIFADGSINSSGIITSTNVSVASSVTATSFYGNAANLTNAGPKGPLQQHSGPGDGSARTLSMGQFNFPNISAAQDINSTTYTDLAFSSVTYKPPSNAIGFLYEVTYGRGWINNHDINHHKLYVDSTEIVYARHTLGGYYREGLTTFKWYFRLGGSDNANTGQFASWTNNKTIKLKARNYGTGYRFKYNGTQYWDGSGTDQYTEPHIKITAFKSH